MSLSARFRVSKDTSAEYDPVTGLATLTPVYRAKCFLCYFLRQKDAYQAQMPVESLSNYGLLVSVVWLIQSSYSFAGRSRQQ